jgi:hypothetical protein
LEITETHKRMLKRLQIQWEREGRGIGRLGIDSKRPYGNSRVHEDIAELAGMRKLDYEKDESYTEVEIAKMRQLHQDMAAILKQLISDACK